MNARRKSHSLRAQSSKILAGFNKSSVIILGKKS